VSGTLTAGCNIGNALTGLSVLAVNSLIGIAAIFGVAVTWPGIRDLLLGLPLARKQK